MRYSGKHALWLLLLATCYAPAQERQTEAEAVHWAYSAYFGTGWYQIDEGQDAFVFRYTPRRTVSAASLDDGGRGHPGIQLRLPVTVGLNHFALDDLGGAVDFENLASVSATPAIYLTWPVNPRWTVRPFAALGWGALLNGEGSAWSYWGGVKSRLILREGEPELALVNSLGFVGYSPDTGHASSFWPVTSALEFRHPAFVAESGATWNLHAHVAYTFFHDDLDLVGSSRTAEPISDQWELGVALSREASQISIWRFGFDRLGLSYRFSTDGDLQGIGLIFGSLFDE